MTSKLVITAADLFWANSRSRHICPEDARRLQTAEECLRMRRGCPRGCHRVTVNSVQLFFGVSSIDQDLQVGYQIDEIKMHPGYNKHSIHNDIARGHDIAILRVSTQVQLNAAIQPVCLPTPLYEEDLTEAEADASITGFGRNGLSGNQLTDNLQLGCLYLVDKALCRERYEKVIENAPFFFPEGEISGQQLCALGEGVDSCQGDSGGGLARNIEGKNSIIGIASFGSKKCNSEVPGVYTSVFPHLDWIQAYMNRPSCSETWSTCNATCTKEGFQTRLCHNGGRETRQCAQLQCEVDGDNSAIKVRAVLLGGWVGNRSKTSTVFMESCPEEGSQIPDLPRKISHGVGAYLPASTSKVPSDSLLLMCGGFDLDTGPSSECFEYKVSATENVLDAIFSEPSEWIQTTNMQKPRANAAISVIGNNKVWISGGRSSRRVVLDSTEVMQKLGDAWTVTEGPDLGRKLASHCAVTVPKERSFPQTIYLTGGANFDSKQSKFVLTNTVTLFKVIEGELEGPNSLSGMRTARSGHACTLVTNQEKSLGIMVAGGKSAANDMLDSVEFLDFSGDRWKELAPLPKKLSGAKMMMKPDLYAEHGGAPILIGGTGFKAGGKKVEDLLFSKDIIAYSNSSNTWSKVGEVVETVAYHELVSIESDICLDIKIEVERKERSDYSDYYDPEALVDIR